MTIELTDAEASDLAKVCRLAAEQCKWRLYSLASARLGGTNDAKTVLNALFAAEHFADRLNAEREKEVRK